MVSKQIQGEGKGCILLKEPTSPQETRSYCLLVSFLDISLANLAKHI